MPRGDGTGPGGMGAMTGRRAGPCGGFGMRGHTNPAPGRGLSSGRGRQHWLYAAGLPGLMRFCGYATANSRPDPETEKQALKNENQALQSELDSIKKRLEEIESKTAGR